MRGFPSGLVGDKGRSDDTEMRLRLGGDRGDRIVETDGSLSSSFSDKDDGDVGVSVPVSGKEGSLEEELKEGLRPLLSESELETS